MMDFVARIGWIWLVAAPVTGAVALVLAAWRLARPSVSAEAEHRRALLAYVLSLVVLSLAPLAIDDRLDAGTAEGQAPPALARSAQAVPPMTTTASVDAATPRDLSILASVVGGFWLLSSVWMANRLVGGCWVVRRLVLRARPCEDAGVRTVALDLASRLGVRGRVRLVETDAPVPMVAGVRPVLLVPAGFASAFDDIRPLLAHELAHVRRRDYLANLLQSAADTVLVALPGARWVSGRVRETREFCCDAMAVRAVGGSAAYVRALATVAAAAARQPAAALGAGGPRLEARVDRLLRGPRASRRRWLRTAVAGVGAIAALQVAGSARQVAVAQTRQASPVAVGEHGFEVITAWTTDQPGAAVTMRRMVSGAKFTCDSAEVRNDANVEVTGIAFSAVVTPLPTPPGGSSHVYTGELVAVSIPPGATLDVAARLLPLERYPDFARDASRFQVMCGISKVTYANGAVWELPRHLVAVTAEPRFGLYAVEVSRALMAPHARPTPGSECLDDRRGAYSRGAVVPVRNEPGTLARCVEVLPPVEGGASMWVEHTLPR
jgi:beta-lactamase regulating signal transducer with metallopeptidase domain